MASLTIRNLEDTLKGRLRVQAASRGHSMEEEARHILRAALSKSAPRESGLVERIRQRFAPLGDVQLVTLPRDPVRDHAPVDRASIGAEQGAAGAGRTAGGRRRR